jgi:hypothetical protein
MEPSPYSCDKLYVTNSHAGIPIDYLKGGATLILICFASFTTCTHILNPLQFVGNLVLQLGSSHEVYDAILARNNRCCTELSTGYILSRGQ